MQDNNNIDYSQLLTATEAASEKDMPPNLLAYHLKKADAPRPVLIGKGKHPFYQLHEIKEWVLNRAPSKTRKNRKTQEE